MNKCCKICKMDEEEVVDFIQNSLEYVELNVLRDLAVIISNNIVNRNNENPIDIAGNIIDINDEDEDEDEDESEEEENKKRLVITKKDGKTKVVINL